MCVDEILTMMTRTHQLRAGLVLYVETHPLQPPGAASESLVASCDVTDAAADSLVVGCDVTAMRLGT